MSKFIDLTGQRFGRLTVLRRGTAPSYCHHKEKVYWLCRCDCGNFRMVSSQSLRIGKAKSCGCLARERQRMVYMGDGKTFSCAFPCISDAATNTGECPKTIRDHARSGKPLKNGLYVSYKPFEDGGDNA